VGCEVHDFLDLTMGVVEGRAIMKRVTRKCLTDRENCLTGSEQCCERANWFCNDLPQATTDDIELRESLRGSEQG
jgi:hypothetical protein